MDHSENRPDEDWHCGCRRPLWFVASARSSGPRDCRKKAFVALAGCHRLARSDQDVAGFVLRFCRRVQALRQALEQGLQFFASDWFGQMIEGAQSHGLDGLEYRRGRYAGCGGGRFVAVQASADPDRSDSAVDGQEHRPVQ